MKLKGSISVFLAIILVVMVLFVGTLLDVSRMLLAKSVVKSAVQISCESMLADYDRPLREQYGIFAMAPLSDSERRQMAIELLAENLTLPQGVKAIDPYGFIVKDADVLTFHNLSEPAVLKQQIAEFMKLRAPVQMVEQFVDKLAAFQLLLGEADSVENKMAVEQLAAKLRTDTVKIHVLLNDYLPCINLNQRNDGSGLVDLKQAVYHRLTACHTSAQQQSDLYEKALSDQKNHPNTLRLAIQKEQTYLAEIDGLVRETQTRLEPVSSQMTSLQQQIDALHAPLAESVQAKKERDQKIAAYRSELAVLAVEKNAIDTELDMHHRSRADQAENVAELEKQLQRIITDNTAILDELVKLFEAMKQQTARLKNHLAMQLTYVEACSQTCDAVVSQALDLQNKKDDIDILAKERDDTVSESVNAQVKQLMEQIDPQLYKGFQVQLGDMKSKLLIWLEPVETHLKEIDQDILVCKNEKQLYSDLNTSIQPTFHAKLDFISTEGFSSVKSGLELLKCYPDGKQVYPIPIWSLQPAVSPEEKLVADRWVQTVLGFEAEMDVVEQEKEELKQVRQAMGQIAKDTMSFFGQDTNENSIVLSEDLLLGLPSKNGMHSSQATLDRIGALGAAALEESYGLFTFGELSGSTQISEHSHGFYQEAAQAVKSIVEALSQTVKAGFRGVVDGMYVNEYILSAFKNAATQNNVLPYDIGWGRDLDSTFFSKGEIEYILYGNTSENTNINMAKGAVWTVRFALNLMHIYKSPEKMSTTLGLATAVAGWTLLGVPLVQNLLIIGWSAAESVWDVGLLGNGSSVPLLKTSQTWHLDFKQLFIKQLQNYAWDTAETAVTDWVQTGISEADQSVRNTIQAMIGNIVDSAFASLESIKPQIDADGVADAKAVSEDLIQSAVAQLITGIRPWSSLDDFSDWLSAIMQSWWAQEKVQMMALGNAALAELKISMKAAIFNHIVNSSAYQGLLGMIQSCAEELIDSGFDQLKGEKTGGTAFRPGQGTRLNAVMLDTTYEDYLRLFLLLIPMDQKLKRIGDLMQLNLSGKAEKEMPMNQYKTAIWMDAHIEMDSWFLINWWQGKGRRGTMQIRTQWGQGY